MPQAHAEYNARELKKFRDKKLRDKRLLGFVAEFDVPHYR